MFPMKRQLVRFFMLDGGPSRNAAMEGLRGFAVMIVVFIHAISSLCHLQVGVDVGDTSNTLDYARNHSIAKTLLHVLAQGHYAVDLFFLLSAFLITRIVMKQETTFSYFSYIRKRAVRIYPPFLAALVFAIAVQHWVIQEIPIRSRIIAENLLFIHGAPIIGWKFPAYNFPAWSLFYEFSFYIVFPMLFWLWRRCQAKDGSAGSYMAGVALLGAVLYVHSYMPRAATFFFGVMLGLRSDDELRKIARGLPTWLVAGTFGFLALAFATYSRNFGWFTPFFSVSVSMLFVKTCYDAGPLHRLFTWMPLRGLGNISFSLYLMNAPVLMLMDRWIHFQQLGPTSVIRGAVYVALGIGLSIAGAIVLFAVAERWYFRKRQPTPIQAAVPEPLRLAA